MHLIGTNRAGRGSSVLQEPGGLVRRAFAPLQRLTSGLGLLALSLTVSGCVSETGSVTLSPAKGVPVEQSIEQFAVAVATADTIAGYCRSYGIGKNYRSSDALTYDYVAKLRAQGHSQAEISRAAERLSRGSTAEEAIRRLEARGVREKDVGSLCRYGKEEIAKGSTVGQLLRLTK